jgi:hypothetical protein
MVFARRRSRIQQANVEIGYASSGFLQFVAMAFRGGQDSQVVSVIATRCSFKEPERRSETSPWLRVRPLASCEASIL